jgi:tellurium resistance protein TerZ
MGVQLQKGSRVKLEKQGGGKLSEIIVGLGWDVGNGPSIDLDASCVELAADKTKIDIVYFGAKNSRDGAIKHSGDNLTGAGEGDDEQIFVNLDKLPANVQFVVFTVNSYRGQSFDRVQNAFIRIVDKSTGAELMKYDLSAKGAHTAMVMAKLYRHNGEWKLQAVGEVANGRTVEALLPNVVACL